MLRKFIPLILSVALFILAGQSDVLPADNSDVPLHTAHSAAAAESRSKTDAVMMVPGTIHRHL